MPIFKRLSSIGKRKDRKSIDTSTLSSVTESSKRPTTSSTAPESTSPPATPSPARRSASPSVITSPMPQPTSPQATPSQAPLVATQSAASQAQRLLQDTPSLQPSLYQQVIAPTAVPKAQLLPQPESLAKFSPYQQVAIPAESQAQESQHSTTSSQSSSYQHVAPGAAPAVSPARTRAVPIAATSMVPATAPSITPSVTELSSAIPTDPPAASPAASPTASPAASPTTPAAALPTAPSVTRSAAPSAAHLLVSPAQTVSEPTPTSQPPTSQQIKPPARPQPPQRDDSVAIRTAGFRTRDAEAIVTQTQSQEEYDGKDAEAIVIRTGSQSDDDEKDTEGLVTQTESRDDNGTSRNQWIDAQINGYSAYDNQTKEVDHPVENTTAYKQGDGARGKIAEGNSTRDIQANGTGTSGLQNGNANGRARGDETPITERATKSLGQDLLRGEKEPPQVSNSTLDRSVSKTTFMNQTSTAYSAAYVDEPVPSHKDEPAATRQDVEATFSQFAQVIHASRRPLPTQTSDGTYPSKDEATGFLSDLRSIGLKDVNTVRKIMEQKASGAPQNDREYLMEEVIQLVAALPDKSKHRVDLTSMFVDELWNGLQHPPMSYLGDEYKYRSADGSKNSYVLPHLGAANTPYARSVNPVTITPGAPPDPYLLFDSLMAREKFEPNPNKVSSIFFNWASLVIHDLFQTSHEDFSISQTSSYLDLSILYGDVQEDQNMMRTFEDGRIKPDCFAEERLLAFPPTSGVLLIMLNRFHNHVVEQLALINEGGRFTKPSERLNPDQAKKAWKKRDEDLFQTGRLVTCGLYINITLYDYLRTIVNLNRTNSTWTLDPRMNKPKKFADDGTPQGVGNQVSAEFALCYRWHACIGETDTLWTEQVFTELLGKNPGDADMRELMIGFAKYDEELPEDPLDRPFAHLKRGPDGRFNDADLAQIMTTGIEQVAGAFGARNTPKALRAATVLAILQARSWNLCTFNEFRAFCGLKKFDTFEEINADPEIAEQLRNLYEHPDYVELYPGIMIEDAKVPMVPGVGICPNHTLARAVLSDAVALVRGDRFYTLDYSPKNLTAWGYAEVQYDLNVNQGCVFHKLMLTALPNHFKPDSIYAHYPMTVPSENAVIMKDLGRFHDYNWDEPKYEPPHITLTSYANVKYLLEHDQDFTLTCSAGLEDIVGGASTFHRKQKEVMDDLIYRNGWEEHIKHFYQYITMRLLHEKTVRIAGINQVDITRDVGNLAHVHFAAGMFDLPLKTEENPKGVFSEHELWMALCTISSAIFNDIEPSKSYALRIVAQKLTAMLAKLIETNVKSVTETGLTARLFDTHRQNQNALADYGVHLLRRLTETGMSAHHVAYSQILPTAVAMVPDQSQAFTQMIDYYLGEGKEHLPDIQYWARSNSTQADDRLLHYVEEGIRLNGTFATYRKAEVEHMFEEAHVKRGDKVFCSSAAAARDPSIFANPDQVDVHRPFESYLNYGTSAHTSTGKRASQVALVAMLRTVAKLPGLRRAPGPQGQLKKIQREGGINVYLREGHESTFAFPTTMKIHYDGEKQVIPIAVVEH